jgi:CRP-like cAMP-binding protein
MLTYIRTAQAAFLNVRLTLDFIDAARRSIDDDLISALLLAGVSIANIEATQQDIAELGHYPKLGDLPDDRRKPVSHLGIALSLGIPRETARRKLTSLVDRGVLTRMDDGIILSSEVVLSEPFIVAVASYLKATATFVSGLAALGACGLRDTDRMARPAWSIGGITTRLMTAHVLRGIDYATRQNPTASLPTQYIALALVYLTGASLRVQSDMSRTGGRLAKTQAVLAAVSVADVARYTRLPYETVRRQIFNLERMGVVIQRDGGKVIDLSDPARVNRWIDFQARTEARTRQVVWKLFKAGVIEHAPPLRAATLSVDTMTTEVTAPSSPYL